jgi:hypothetical protein
MNGAFLGKRRRKRSKKVMILASFFAGSPSQYGEVLNSKYGSGSDFANGVSAVFISLAFTIIITMGQNSN